MNRIAGYGIALLLLALSVSTEAVAQEKENRQKNHAELMQARAELHERIRQYSDAEIIPQLRIWKQKLDGAMSEADLTSLNALRDRADQLRKTAMEHVAAMRQAREAGNYEEVKNQRRALREMKKERRALKKELKPLGKNYRSTLEEIGAEAKPYAERWRRDIREIVKQWKQEHRELLESADRPCSHRGKRYLAKESGLPYSLGRKHRAARFMLWNGDNPIEHQDSGIRPNDLPNID